MTRRRTRVDFYHLFDDDELFLAPIILIIKKFRVSIGVATRVRHKIGVATRVRHAIGIATVHRTKTQG